MVDFFVGLIMLVLGLRILFRLFDANPSAGFVNWIYDTSDVIIAPFRGIFPPATIEQGNVLDVSALFAVLIYAVLGYLLSSFLASVTTDSVDDKPTRKNRK
ncbi:MAG: YggT family protein [Candidatus Saccharimonadales bacterium]